MLTSEYIAALAAKRAFGSKLITNVNRGLVVEAIVSTVLCPEWEWCSEDYWRCDFRQANGLQLEVRQSAACQSWPSKPSSGRWDIGVRKGFYEGERYIEAPGRSSQIYILAWHGIEDRALADHRDPAQWVFFVVAASNLPQSKTIGRCKLEERTSAIKVEALAANVTALVDEMIGLTTAAGPMRLAP